LLTPSRKNTCGKEVVLGMEKYYVIIAAVDDKLKEMK